MPAPTVAPPARDPVAPPSGVQPPGRPRPTGPVVLGVVLVALGSWALLAALGVEVPGPVVAGALLVVSGAGLLASGLRGEPRPGWTGPVAVVAVVVAVVALVTSDAFRVAGTVGDQVHRPTIATQLEEEYRVLAGSLEVDLRAIEVPVGTTVVELSTVLGEVVVHVPKDAHVVVDTDVGGGQSSVFGYTREGLGVDNDRSVGAGSSERRLEVHVSVGLGEVRVTE